MADPAYDEVPLTPEELKALGLPGPTQETPLTEAERLDLGLSATPPPPKDMDPGLWASIVHSFGAGGTKQGSDELVGEIVQHAPGTIPGDETYRKARDAERSVLDAAK